MVKKAPREKDLLGPVLRLFPKTGYRRFVEVPLGRKSVDVLCVPKKPEVPQVCIELKVNNWRKALWQAIINFQIADQSFITVWHEYRQSVEKHLDLLDQYGVGLICVGPRSAKIILPSQDKVRRIAREAKRDLYAALRGGV